MLEGSYALPARSAAVSFKVRLERLERAIEARECPRCHGRPQTVAGDDGPLAPHCPECGRPALITKVYLGICIGNV